VIRYFWSHFYRPKNKRKNQIKIQKKQKTLNDINSKFGEFMSSFHFLPTKKLTWEIHATLWDGAGRSHTYGGECSLRVSQHSSDIVWSYLDSHFRSFSHWVFSLLCNVLSLYRFSQILHFVDFHFLYSVRSLSLVM
jgi:hypothetical protein